jgi:hypothetical protein
MAARNSRQEICYSIAEGTAAGAAGGGQLRPPLVILGMRGHLQRRQRAHLQITDIMAHCPTIARGNTIPAAAREASRA